MVKVDDKKWGPPTGYGEQGKMSFISGEQGNTSLKNKGNRGTNAILGAGNVEN